MEAIEPMPAIDQDSIREQFTQLVDQHRRIAFKVSNTYCWHVDDRAELSQEILMQCWRAFPSYDTDRSFSTWMYRIALNVAISYVRHHSLRQKHHIPLEPDTHEVSDQAASGQDDVEFLYRFIDQLDTLNRALLVLYMEDHSYQEIADVLGISESNVSTKIHRLKRRLRKASEGETAKENTNAQRSLNHGT